MPRGVTPISAGYRIDMRYTTGGLGHVQQLRCNAIVSGGAYHLGEVSGSSVLAATAMTHLAAVTAPVMPTACTFDTYTLYQYVSGVYNPVESGTIGTVGSGGADVEPTGVLTAKLRDTGFKPVNVQLFGSGFSAPRRATYLLSGTDISAYVSELLNTADNHVGAWFVGRASLPMRSGGFVTISLSRQSRKRLGLV